MIANDYNKFLTIDLPIWYQNDSKLKLPLEVQVCCNDFPIQTGCIFSQKAHISQL